MHFEQQTRQQVAAMAGGAAAAAAALLLLLVLACLALAMPQPSSWGQQVCWQQQQWCAPCPLHCLLTWIGGAASHSPASAQAQWTPAAVCCG